MPTPSDASSDPDSAAAALALLDPCGPAFAALSVLHAPSLSDEGLLDAVTASQKLLASIAGKQQEFLAELARRDPDGEQFLRDEVACVLQVAPATGQQSLEVAAQLAGRLADTLELVTGGFLPYPHARVLAIAVAHCPDQVALKVQDRVLPRGCRQTLSQFRASVRRAVARFDCKSDAERHADAFSARKVVCYDGADYMAEVVLDLAADGAATVMTAINTWALKCDRDDDRTLDQRRADAIVEICDAALDMPGLPRRHGMRPALTVTVAASTLAGQDDQPAELEGYGPIPAAMARRIAAMPGATRTEIPVDANGRVVEPTGAADSYTAPVRIARTVIARDHTCLHRPADRPRLCLTRRPPRDEASAEEPARRASEARLRRGPRDPAPPGPVEGPPCAEKNGPAPPGTSTGTDHPNYPYPPNRASTSEWMRTRRRFDRR